MRRNNDEGGREIGDGERERERGAKKMQRLRSSHKIKKIISELEGGESGAGISRHQKSE